MDTKLRILQQLDEICRALDLDDLGDIQWGDAQLLRKCTIRADRGDPTAWHDFIAHLSQHREVAYGFTRILEDLGWAACSVEMDRLELTLPSDFLPLDDATHAQLTTLLNPSFDTEDEKPTTEKLTAQKPGIIMYIEEKPGLAGHARIGRVTFSATRKTIYYAGRKLQSLKGGGYKANYYDIDTHLRYWISNCKKNGDDSLYPAIIEIDADAREEYWTTIRQLPGNLHLTTFRSAGKHAKRRPM